MDTLSMKRYELPTPPPGKMTDVQVCYLNSYPCPYPHPHPYFQAWTECVENSGAQLEHQRTRIMNLDLMLDYGAESWKQYNEVLQDMLNRIQVIVDIVNTNTKGCQCVSLKLYTTYLLCPGPAG